MIQKSGYGLFSYEKLKTVARDKLKARIDNCIKFKKITLVIFFSLKRLETYDLTIFVKTFGDEMYRSL